MSDSDCEDFIRGSRKRKRRAQQLNESATDSSIEYTKKRKNIPRVSSDFENSSDSGSDLELVTRKKKPRKMPIDDDSDGSDSDVGAVVTRHRRVPRVLDGPEQSSSSSSEGVTSGEEMEDEECEEGDSDMGSEEDSFEGESSGEDNWESDWQSEDETEDSHGPVASTPQKVEPQPAAASASAGAEGWASDSSDGQSEKCPICLRTFTDQEVGTPEACDHSFCVTCLEEWSKNVNTCPVDRQMFSLILVRRSLGGRVVRRVPIEVRPPEGEASDEDPTFCEVCGQSNREDRLLLCDGCDLGYHLECLDPPMDTVPVEEWFCPECVSTNPNQYAEEVDIYDGEVSALIEDAREVGFPAPRPRMSRLLPRTRQSERVRATIRRREQRDTNVHPSTSSGIDSLEVESTTSAGSNRRTTLPTGTVQKRRKTSTRKTVKRKRRKRRTGRTSKLSKTALSKKSGGKAPTKRKKKRVKIKKRKATSHKRRVARVTMPLSVKGRIAEQLGMRPPNRPGQTIPEVRSRAVRGGIEFQRNRAGIPTLHLFGQRDQLDFFSSSDGEVGGGDGGYDGSVSVLSRPRTSAARTARNLANRKMLSASAIRSHSAIRSSSAKLQQDLSTSSPCDLVGSILNSQTVWHSKKSVVTINRDGSLQVKRDSENERNNRTDSSQSSSSVSVSSSGDSGLVIRNDDALSRISSENAHLNLNHASSSASSAYTTQAPMYPGRGNSGGSRGPSGGGYNQFGDSRYGGNSSYHSYQGGQRGYSNNLSPPSSFDSRGSRAGYANYLNSGPPSPFRGGPPVRFRMAPRFPVRRPFQPPQRHQAQQPEQNKDEEFPPEDTEPLGDSPTRQRGDEDDEEIDIYSDIEVGAGGGPGSELEESDRGLEMAYDLLPPPPVPPALLMEVHNQAPSDEEAGSDSELVIDDRAAASPQRASTIPESEKYDPAEPSYDTDEDEDGEALVINTSASMMDIPLPSEKPETASSQLLNSASNSSASYLHSPTYGTSSAAEPDRSGGDGYMTLPVQETSNNHSTDPLNREAGSKRKPSSRHSSLDGDENDDAECPNFSIYSAASMNIARGTEGKHEVAELSASSEDHVNITHIEEDKASIHSPCESDEEAVVDTTRASDVSLAKDSEVVPDEHNTRETYDSKPEEAPESPHAEDVSDSEQKSSEVGDSVKEIDKEDAKNKSLVEEIFGSDDDSLVGGATSAVSAATTDNHPQTATPHGLEGLETETISETEEAINFDDDLSQEETGFLTAEEDGEIPSIKTKLKKRNRKALEDKGGPTPISSKGHLPQDSVDYEEGEIVDERPKLQESTKKDKVSEKKDKTAKYEAISRKNADENTDITKSKGASTDEDKRKKKKKSSSDKNRQSKERTVLGSSENKDKVKEKTNRTDDTSISWKKPSKNTKERNYRDPKTKQDSKETDTEKKSSAVTKDAGSKKDKKKKEKRKDMERYDVRKIVSDKKRKRRDEFGRDLSRDRSYTRSRSRSRARSYEKSHGRSRSRSLSRSRVNRSKGRSPVRARLNRSRSRSRNHSRSRSKHRYKRKSKDRTRRSRSKDKARNRLSRERSSRSRGRRSRTKSRSRSMNRSRLRSRSRSLGRARDRKERSRERRLKSRDRRDKLRSFSKSWTPSWSRSLSRSPSCSSCSRSRTPSLRGFNRSYSRSFSRSWSRERHERVPVIEKTSAAISKSAKKLTVIVTNTKDDSERQKKKDKKRKDAKKIKEPPVPEKKKKRKEKSPAPSKEVFTSGDNILVSVNFNKSNKSSGKDAASTAAVSAKDAIKRKHEIIYDGEPNKKVKKDKGNKEKSPRSKGSAVNDRANAKGAGDKKIKKGLKLSPRVAAVINKKPVAIIDLDQSPFREQTPSPTDLIVLSDSEDDARKKDNNREDISDSMVSRRGMRQSSASPKTSSKTGLNASSGILAARMPESHSPPMSVIMNYLITSTGPKTPPEPQIKFSISSKPQLRSFTNPLQEEEEMMGEDAAMDDDLDQRIEEELDRGLGEILHKGPNTPPEPRGPTTPCSPPTSPDAYDPFDPTKSGTPSPAEPCTSMDGPPSPDVTLSEDLLRQNVGGRCSPVTSEIDGLGKSLDVHTTSPAGSLREEVQEEINQSPERLKVSGRTDSALTKSPSTLAETPLPQPSDADLSQSLEPTEATEKVKQKVSTPSEPVSASEVNGSPDRKIAVVITSQQQKLQQSTPMKQQLFPATSQAPVTSTPSHSTAPTPGFPSLTPTNIATLLRTPPPTGLPLSRVNLFSHLPPVLLPQMMGHHHILNSPVVRPTLAEKTTTQTKLTPNRTSAVQNGDQMQTSQKQGQDTSTTDVVDMDLESPYSPGSSEGDDLFEPPADHSKSTSMQYSNRTGSKNNSGKLPLPPAVGTRKSPSKPPGDKFDAIFSAMPRGNKSVTPSKGSGRQGGKTTHPKLGKAKQHKAKGGKKEIAIKMDEDQLQILDELPSSAVELQVKDKFLKKLNRQERVVEEVKLSLKPHYTKKHITKEEYKDILRRSVPKICHNRSGEINPIKISTLVEAYVRKIRYSKRKNASSGGGGSGASSKPKTKASMWS